MDNVYTVCAIMYSIVASIVSTVHLIITLVSFCYSVPNNSVLWEGKTVYAFVRYCDDYSL